MSSKTDLNLQISALQRQPCLLKTNSTQMLWWRGWLRYGWSSVHHRIKPALTIWLVWWLWSGFWSGIISPQRSNARPNFPTSNVVGGAKFVLAPRLMNSNTKIQLGHQWHPCGSPYLHYSRLLLNSRLCICSSRTTVSVFRELPFPFVTEAWELWGLSVFPFQNKSYCSCIFYKSHSSSEGTHTRRPIQNDSATHQKHWSR